MNCRIHQTLRRAPFFTPSSHSQKGLPIFYTQNKAAAINQHLSEVKPNGCCPLKIEMVQENITGISLWVDDTGRYTFLLRGSRNG